MTTDWKDALSALKESNALPEGDSMETSVDESHCKAHVQKTPLYIVIERKGRGGKTATIIERFEGSDSELQALAKTLKQKLGTGGSARGGEILIQGDRRKEAAEILHRLGYKTLG